MILFHYTSKKLLFPIIDNYIMPFCSLANQRSHSAGRTTAAAGSPSVTSRVIRAFSPLMRFFSGAAVLITNAIPTTFTLNSRISSTMPPAVPPPFRKSSTISAFWFSFTARRLRLIVSILPLPET